MKDLVEKVIGNAVIAMASCSTGTDKYAAGAVLMYAHYSQNTYNFIALVAWLLLDAHFSF